MTKSTVSIECMESNESIYCTAVMIWGGAN